MATQKRFVVVVMSMMAGMSSAQALAGNRGAAEEGVSHQIGLTVSKYKYIEDNFMSLEATKVGIDYSIKIPFGGGWFVKGDLRYANGKADYESSGTGSSKDHKDWYTDSRALVGYDFTIGNHGISPFGGLGYRLLRNDLRGTTSTGATGYQRMSQYLYLPIGLAHRVSFGTKVSLSTTVEYDYLIRGRQDSYTSDLEGHGYQYFDDLSNKQRHGHGWRASMLLQTGSWSFGPYASYWRIADSEPDQVIAVDDSGTTWLMTGIEPKNKTREAGIKVLYNF